MSAATAALTLRQLLDGMAESVPELKPGKLCLDSRVLQPGDLFVALKGLAQDGHDFLGQAAAAGACAALVETRIDKAPGDLPLIVVDGLRERLGVIASRQQGDPSRRLHVAAVTGTNGKTTISQIFAQLVRAAHYDCGVIGTLGASNQTDTRQTLHTTPDPIALQSILADWAAQAVPFVSMEASSHALDQGRLNGVEIDTAVFSNLTRDHLDYHGNMQAYGAAKARLFEFASLRAAVLNADDPFSEELSSHLAPGVSVLRYSLESDAADVRLRNLRQDASGLRAKLESPWGNAALHCPLLGRFNAANLLAALTAVLQAGLPFDSTLAAVEELRPVPGRMEPLRKRGAPLVVVDYAHTPDALHQVLSALRALPLKRLLVVFGCGGDRDRGKRPLMAEAVSAFADLALITSDNPRGEDPLAIIADIEAAMHCDYEVRADRGEAIAAAIGLATADDCVLIAGKGHEDYQLLGSERRPFSDVAAARSAMEGLAA